MRVIAGDDRTPWLDVYVLCDGVELQKCLAADTEAGVALVQPHDEQGRLLLTDDRRSALPPAVVRGTITFRLSEHGRERWTSVDQLVAFYTQNPRHPDRIISVIRRLNAAIRETS